jgi:hypothetical protein
LDSKGNAVLSKLIYDAKEEFRDWYMPDGASQGEVDRFIYEGTDTVHYYGELHELLGDNFSLGIIQEPSDYVHVYDIVESNVKQAIVDALWVYKDELDEQIEETEENKED